MRLLLLAGEIDRLTFPLTTFRECGVAAECVVEGEAVEELELAGIDELELDRGIGVVEPELEESAVKIIFVSDKS